MHVVSDFFRNSVNPFGKEYDDKDKNYSHYQLPSLKKTADELAKPNEKHRPQHGAEKIPHAS